MRLKKLTIALIFSILLLIIALPLAFPASAADDIPRYGGHLRIGVKSDPETMCSMVSVWGDTHLQTRQIFSRLITQKGKTLNIEIQGTPFTVYTPVADPDLVSDWSISSDFKTYTLHIVKNATFHDGVPVTIKDIKFSLIQWLHAPTSTSWRRAIFLNSGLGSIDLANKNLETPDDYTIIFHFNQSVKLREFLQTVTIIDMLPEHIYGSYAFNLAESPNLNNPIGSGPFKFIEIKEGEYMTCERYDNYFKTDEYGNRLPYLDKITFLIKRKPAAAIMALEAGEIDLTHRRLSPPAEEVARLDKDPRFVGDPWTRANAWRIHDL
jgi:ABC-type transport system substrate-binding protein